MAGGTLAGGGSRWRLGWQQLDQSLHPGDDICLRRRNRQNVTAMSCVVTSKGRARSAAKTIRTSTVTYTTEGPDMVKIRHLPRSAAYMLYYHTMSFSEVDSVHVQALTRRRWMAEAPTRTTNRRASAPGSPSSESFCRLWDVGIGPLSEPSERELMPKRPLDSRRARTGHRGSPSRFCPEIRL